MKEQSILNDKKLNSLSTYKRAIELIKKEKIVVDSNALPIIEAAEAWDRKALHLLHSKLTSGEVSSSKNYHLALRCLRRLRRLDGDDPVLKFYSTRCLGDTHYKFGHFKKAQKEYTNAARIMIHLPVKKWDFELLKDIEELIKIN